jgi:hypothetical protein
MGVLCLTQKQIESALEFLRETAQAVFKGGDPFQQMLFSRTTRVKPFIPAGGGLNYDHQPGATASAKFLAQRICR